jgi:protease IV
MLARVISIISVVCLLGSVVKAEPASAPAGKPEVAVFELSGDLSEQPVDNSLAIFGQQGQSLRDVVSRMDKVAKDPNVKAVVLLADDASFGLAQAEELRQAMGAIRAAGKDVYSQADDLMMGQYLLLSGASRLSVSPTGEIWAVGLYGDQLYLHGLLTKIGVQPDFLHCGAYKSASELFMRDGPSPEADAMENWLLDSAFDSVVNLVASGRNVSAGQVKQWIDNGPYTAEKAKGLGMIDAVEDRAGLEQLLRQKYGEDVVFDKKYAEEKPPELNLSNPFALMAVLAQLMNPQKSEAGKPAIGVVYVDGMIVTGKADSSGLGNAMAASTDIARALDQAASDDSIKAVVLRVDSPGGSATASEIILKATERVKAKKPLVVSMGDVAGSGGYFVTCAADTVFADNITITASIGVVGGKLVTTQMWNNIGVNWKGYQRGASADLLATDTDFSPEEKQKMQSWMDEVYGVFKGNVVSGRGNKLKKPIDELAAGRVFTGKQAIDLGLVDRIGTLADAISFAANQAKMSEYDVRTVPEPKNFLQKLMEQSSGEDDDEGHVAMAMNGNWLEKLAAPYLAGLDPRHVGEIRTALGELEMMQSDQVLMVMAGGGTTLGFGR